jgi:hypothetical protein
MGGKLFTEQEHKIEVQWSSVTLCSQAYWFTNEMLAEASYGSGLPPI